ncbi:hypothetical protein [Wenjunlia tyrosinilytica]|uniref:DUF3558 domain-containing protein n=1 Tax=Wenjunlia tyrosinilytica TaxID=1544741 RepID=A0A917ZVS8_9ACTN|nr:hypothetical protein [Wenjunlia tyrosinilytica]GGO98051.1 hypothetical protein GCM10012280_61280 [Wenjunlia tyrosinilytica]
MRRSSASAAALGAVLSAVLSACAVPAGDAGDRLPDRPGAKSSLPPGAKSSSPSGGSHPAAPGRAAGSRSFDLCAVVPAADIQAASGELDHHYGCRRTGDRTWRWNSRAEGERGAVSVTVGVEDDTRESVARVLDRGGSPFHGIGRGGRFTTRPHPTLGVYGPGWVITVSVRRWPGETGADVPSAARLGIVADTVRQNLPDGRGRSA